jgi:hypothetical protein
MRWKYRYPEGVWESLPLRTRAWVRWHSLLSWLEDDTGGMPTWLLLLMIGVLAFLVWY